MYFLMMNGFILACEKKNTVKLNCRKMFNLIIPSALNKKNKKLLQCKRPLSCKCFIMTNIYVLNGGLVMVELSRMNSCPPDWSWYFKGPEEMMCHRRCPWCWLFNPPRGGTCWRLSSQAFLSVGDRYHHTNWGHQSLPPSHDQTVALSTHFQPLISVASHLF